MQLLCPFMLVFLIVPYVKSVKRAGAPPADGLERAAVLSKVTRNERCGGSFDVSMQNRRPRSAEL